MDANELMELATKSAREQITVAQEALEAHLDAADRIHQRIASETLGRIAEIQAIGNVAKELSTNPT